MITYWKNQNGLFEIPQYELGCWVNVTNPTVAEIESLTGRFKIPKDFIDDILDVDERSRMEIEDEWLLLIIRIPVHSENNGLPYYTVPFGTLISNEYLITICVAENEITKEIITVQKNKPININDRTTFILRLFLKSARTYLRFLKQINQHTNQIESDLAKATKNQELHRLLKMEKCLVYFITSLKSNELLLDKLKTSRFAIHDEEHEDLFEDVMIENKQAIEMSNIYSNILSGMMDAFASVISNNLSVIMKRLTSVTLILMIPTLIASIYGMNLKNFMEDSAFGFGAVILMSLIISVGAIVFFRLKKWF
ncbi:MAG: magnesium transporter CorA family protein [Bacteroidia bacterium]|nr:magnesium transporter CorA family protein [Bacteroidia bacterium]